MSNAVVQLSNTLQPGSKQIVDYRVTQSDGSPLPEWLDRAAKDLLIGCLDAGTETLPLKVEAVYSDGLVIAAEVTIDTVTGEIKPATADFETEFMHVYAAISG